MRKDFIPLLFAGDINIYSVARAFHEAYGVKPKGYGKLPTGPCYRSDIIDYEAVEKADDEETFVRLVKNFADENSIKKVLLIGCGDNYVDLISKNKDRFPSNVICPYIDIDLMRRLTNKEEFYRLCEEVGVDYPDTFVYRKEMGDEFDLPFEPPFIIKPSNSVTYWKHPFEGQDKVFKTKDEVGLRKILKKIYDAGYEDSVIIQNFIPGDDSYMRVLTSYSGKDGSVKMMCLGHVLLEEHTPKGIGNHAVIITESNPKLEEKFRKFLDLIEFVGFSNFDIKYDERDGKYKVFEINTRQGRSNYYVTGSGGNIARYLVDDYIDNKSIDFHVIDEENLWMVVPKKVAFDYINPTYHNKLRELIKKKKVVNPLLYKKDRNLYRKLKVIKNIQGHRIKFKKYLGK